MLRVLTVVGARPQFIKAAVVSKALEGVGVEEILVHTGQHHDQQMSDVFFRELDVRAPDHHLGIHSGSHAFQTGHMMEALEHVMEAVRPDRVVVYGDTNSTLAAAIAAAKLHLPVDHVEAGLRSFDRDMPEEVNRILTDHVSDLLFCPTAVAARNLADEGIDDGVHVVGDVMLDLALQTRKRATRASLAPELREGEYFVATVHRASNTDVSERLCAIVAALSAVARDVGPVVLPVHPRLAHRLAALGVGTEGIMCIAPVGYVEMQGLLARARGVITDSGGVQKEAMFHGVRCVTLRDSTEWVESLEAGMNVLLGDDLDALPQAAADCCGRGETPPRILEAYGGGRAGAAIASKVREAGTTRRRWRR